NGLLRAALGGSGVRIPTVYTQLLITALPILAIAGILLVTYRSSTAPVVEASAAGLIEAGGAFAAEAGSQEQSAGLIGAPESEEETKEEEEKPQELSAPPGAEEQKPAAEAQPAAEVKPAAAPAAAEPERRPLPTWYYVVLAIALALALVLYWAWTWERLQVFKMLLASFFPLALLILAVLGSIVLGLATPAEAAAVGAFGAFILTAVYRFVAQWGERAQTRASPGEVVWRTLKQFGSIIKESSFLTAKTSAMVCWLFVGSGIFSAAFALLGGQELLEKWVLSLNLSPIQFMILAQIIIFILGWPLEWTEIIVIFMPIFIPLLPHFGIDPLFFGLLVALNLQTAFLSPPVAMAAFYLKGVSPPHVSLNAIFAGMLPFMGIQVIALILLYTFPGIGLWLPNVFYGR
ncbi:MAG TPA: TRAP transporter large permease subunit, partial [Burkholderiales bacterium]|nr:TRAP transporter large permease subunit [Burkholderiales bacterium]